MLGYRKGEDGKPEIIPEEADTVKLIYRGYLDGMSLGLIEDEIERDLAQRAAEASENTEETTEDYDEQEEVTISDDYAENPEETKEKYE